ncbi:ferredoxin [Streptomyces sp. NPDC006208]|uniref:ferredoxin n=1 Tax=unclassified Streptomyces TaxID=2593676 RepID=UPI002E24C98C
MTPLRYPDGHVGHLVTGLQTARSDATPRAEQRAAVKEAAERCPTAAIRIV